MYVNRINSKVMNQNHDSLMKRGGKNNFFNKKVDIFVVASYIVKFKNYRSV